MSINAEDTAIMFRVALHQMRGHYPMTVATDPAASGAMPSFSASRGRSSSTTNRATLK
jgi:hypothetical protein